MPLVSQKGLKKSFEKNQDRIMNLINSKLEDGEELVFHISGHTLPNEAFAWLPMIGGLMMMLYFKEYLLVLTTRSLILIKVDDNYYEYSTEKLSLSEIQSCSMEEYDDYSTLSFFISIKEQRIFKEIPKEWAQEFRVKFIKVKSNLIVPH